MAAFGDKIGVFEMLAPVQGPSGFEWGSKKFLLIAVVIFVAILWQVFRQKGSAPPETAMKRRR